MTNQPPDPMPPDFPKTWSRGFLDLAGSAPDFPYPGEPPPVEPGPDLDS